MREPLVLPNDRVWKSLGLSIGPELHAGYQSMVFLAQVPSGRVVVKLSDERMLGEAFESRVALLHDLSEVTDAVVGPVQLRSGHIERADGWAIVCYPYVEGREPDIESREDVTAMVAAMVELHESLATLDGRDVPEVAALRGAASASGAAARAGRRLIHGDYAASNLVVTADGIRVIDFDDCGYGTVDFEIGNSLYMVLFDGWLDGDFERYERFRRWFVDRYRVSAVRSEGASLDDASLDEAIAIRIGALRRWLGNPAIAPIGIRTASTSWRRRLGAFVDEVG